MMKLPKKTNFQDFSTFPPAPFDAIESRPVSFDHVIPIVGALGDAQAWQEHIKTIRSAGPSDSVTLYINSPGGYLSTAAQILNAMEECQAPIVAKVTGECASAATLLFLKADYHEISDDSDFMVHTASYGEYGKDCDVLDSVNFQHKRTLSMLKRHYEFFLDEEEISSVATGKQLWMDPEEVRERLQARHQSFIDKYKAEYNKTGSQEAKNQLLKLGVTEAQLVVSKALQEVRTTLPKREDLMTWTKKQLVDYILSEDEESDLF